MAFLCVFATWSLTWAFCAVWTHGGCGNLPFVLFANECLFHGMFFVSEVETLFLFFVIEQ